jgi:hypothetical protein
VGLDLIVGDALALDVLINCAAMVLIVAEGVEHLGKREMGGAAQDGLIWFIWLVKFNQTDQTDRKTNQSA